MGLRAIKIKASDDYFSNSDGTHYKPTKQGTASQSFVSKINIYTKTGATQPLYLWVFDTASGSAASADPKHVRPLIAGVSDTWDFNSGGSLFKNGVYMVIATNEPTDPTTTPTVAGDDQAIITGDYIYL